MAAAEARARQDRLTKPRGALGRLEALSVQLAGIAGVCPPPVPTPAAVAVFAADHGVVTEGVTPWPQAVTAQLVASFVSGGAAGARALVTGEMGIGNTTAAAALVAAFTGRPAVEVTGRGTGVDDAGLAHKTAVVERALVRHSAAVAAGPLEALAALGGYEIAALAGFIVGG